MRTRRRFIMKRVYWLQKNKEVQLHKALNERGAGMVGYALVLALGVVLTAIMIDSDLTNSILGIFKEDATTHQRVAIVSDPGYKYVKRESSNVGTDATTSTEINQMSNSTAQSVSYSNSNSADNYIVINNNTASESNTYDGSVEANYNVVAGSWYGDGSGMHGGNVENRAYLQTLFKLDADGVYKVDVINTDALVEFELDGVKYSYKLGEYQMAWLVYDNATGSGTTYTDKNGIGNTNWQGTIEKLYGGDNYQTYYATGSDTGEYYMGFNFSCRVQKDADGNYVSTNSDRTITSEAELAALNAAIKNNITVTKMAEGVYTSVDIPQVDGYADYYGVVSENNEQNLGDALAAAFAEQGLDVNNYDIKFAYGGINTTAFLTTKDIDDCIRVTSDGEGSKVVSFYATAKNGATLSESEMLKMQNALNNAKLSLKKYESTTEVGVNLFTTGENSNVVLQKGSYTGSTGLIDESKSTTRRSLEAVKLDQDTKYQLIISKDVYTKYNINVGPLLYNDKPNGTSMSYLEDVGWITTSTKNYVSQTDTSYIYNIDTSRTANSSGFSDYLTLNIKKDPGEKNLATTYNTVDGVTKTYEEWIQYCFDNGLITLVRVED